MKPILFILFALLTFNVHADSDIEIFASCFGAEPVDECEKADFDQDGTINIFDFLIFRQGLRFDLNGDHIIDYTGFVDD